MYSDFTQVIFFRVDPRYIVMDILIAVKVKRRGTFEYKFTEVFFRESIYNSLIVTVDHASAVHDIPD